MKVLHLPINIASQISVTVRALRDIGIDAKGLAIGSAKVQEDRDVVSFRAFPRTDPLRWFASNFRLAVTVLNEIRLADIVHWHFGSPVLPKAVDLAWANALGKPGVVEFWGSDIRIPEVLAAENPYYAHVYSGEGYEYKRFESRELSYRRQEQFSRNGVKTCFVPEMSDRYLMPGLFTSVYRNRVRLILGDFQPRYPGESSRPPVLVHAPTAKIAKGTNAVLAAVRQLERKYRLDFRLIHDVPRQEAIRMIAECDVFLDQFVLGTTYGLAAVEAMALGKPVVCYLMSSALAEFPNELPVVNANPDNLAETLEPLVRSSRLRNRIGRQSRLYAETHHDAHRYAEWLKPIYERILETR